MAGFSIDAALKSGFRLAKREWKAVFAWGFGYVLVALAIQMLSIGPALPEYLQAVLEDPAADTTAIQDQTPGSYFLFALPMMIVLSIGAAAVFYGAVARAMLRPEERGFFFLRLSKRELWVGLTSLTLGLAAVVAGLLITAVVSFLAGMAGGTDSGLLLWGILLGLPAFVGFLYLAMRFSPAWVQAFAEERFVLVDAWRLTRGQGWRLVLMALALVFLVLIICVVVMIPAVIVGGVLLGVAGVAGGGSATVVAVLLLVFGVVFFSALYGFFLAVAAAPYVEVYRSLKAG
ncbi:hypothetical protein [Phenylobacterium sp.]|uniref:hypothetical protein n=1 Tax=Phenylobacterium sp. TaxID=1871053 RepID=UPI0028123895|nr:hypothetical protein [Phenylobacterium sp.]